MASPTAAKKPLDEANEPTKGRFLIFFASFMTLIAAGMGFAIRAGILDDWSTQFGFTKAQLGGITGGGLVGFGVTIIFFSLFVDLIGYKALLILAFLLHALSAVITLAATPVFNAAARIRPTGASGSACSSSPWPMAYASP
jgi:MFS family permease